MGLYPGNFASRLHVPQANRAIFATGRERLAVSQEDHGIHEAPVPFKHVQGFAGANVPNPCHVVAAYGVLTARPLPFEGHSDSPSSFKIGGAIRDADHGLVSIGRVWKRSIWFNGKRKNKGTGVQEEHIYPRFVPFVATNFNRILGEEPDPVPGQHIAATAEAKKRSP
jgi:hypothetical protein